MRVTGTWQGAYVYGPDYGAGSGKRVPFTMSLSESWLARVTGWVRDDPSEGGMPEQGTILGRRRRRSLEFTKEMPHHYMVEDGRLVDIREWCKRVHGATLARHVPPHRIVYIGDLSPDAESIVGTWSIVSWVAESDIGLFEMGEGTGSWTARRISGGVHSV